MLFYILFASLVCGLRHLVFGQDLAFQMTMFGVTNTTDIEQDLLLFINPSNISQYTTMSGSNYVASSLKNYVNNSEVTISGFGTTLPVTALLHSNVPSQPVYTISFNRASSHYFQLFNTNRTDYFSNFTSGITIIAIGSMTAAAGTRFIDFSTNGADSIYLGFATDGASQMYSVAYLPDENGTPAFTGGWYPSLYQDIQYYTLISNATGTRSLMVNRTVVATRDGGVPPVVNRTRSIIGQKDFFSGNMGDILVWNRTLTDVELSQVHLYLENKYFTCGAGKTGRMPSCSLCPVDTYLPFSLYKNAFTQCLQCPNGLSGTVLGGTSQSSCTVCSRGRTSNGTHCISCASGFYKNAPGNGTCTACPAGTLSDGIRAACYTPLATKINTFAPTAGVTADIERGLLVNIDPSEPTQYMDTNNRLAFALSNGVPHNLTRIQGYASDGNLPKATLLHSNIPGNAVYTLAMDRVSSSYLEILFETPDYFSNFTEGITVVTIAHFSIYGYHEKLLHIQDIQFGRNAYTSQLRAQMSIENGSIEVSALGGIMTTERTIYSLLGGSQSLSITQERNVVASRAMSRPLNMTNRARAYVGRGSLDVDNYYTGNIGDVLIWNRMLNQTELQAVYLYLEQKYYSCAGGKYGKFPWCQTCPPSAYLPTGTRYNASTLITDCISCPNGLSSTTAGRTSASCTVCAANRYPLNGACVPCNTGTFKNYPGNASCVSCPSYAYTNVNDNPFNIPCHHNLTAKVKAFGANVATNLDRNLILHLDPSILAQHVNISGVLNSFQLSNFVTNNAATVDGITSNSNQPLPALYSSNTLLNPAYTVFIDRSRLNHYRIRYPNAPDYFANFSSGITILVFGLATMGGYSHHFFDAGVNEGVTNDNIRLRRLSWWNAFSGEIPEANNTTSRAQAEGLIFGAEYAFFGFSSESPGLRYVSKNRGIFGQTNTTFANKVANRPIAYIGRSNYPSYLNGESWPLHGQVGDMFIWNRTLTTDEFDTMNVYIENKYYTCGAGRWGKAPNCARCSVDSYMPPELFYNVSANGCLKCPNGFSGVSLGQTSIAACTVCGPGFQPVDGSCSPCPQGSFKNVAGNSSCIACPPFATVGSGVSCNHTLLDKMMWYNVNVSGLVNLERDMLIDIDASIATQYLNMSGTMVAAQLNNYVASNTTVNGFHTTGSLPSANVLHTNTPNGDPVYMIDFLRAQGHHFQLSFPDNYFANFSAGFTFVTFGMFNSYGNGERLIEIGSWESYFGDTFYFARTNPEHQQSIELTDTAGSNVLTTSGGITHNDRLIYAFTAASPGNRTTYVGRTAIATKTGGIVRDSSERRFAYIGRNLGNSPFFNGSIGEILLWNRTLSQFELDAVFSYLEQKYYSCGAGKYGKYPWCTNCPPSTFMPTGTLYNASALISQCLPCPNGLSATSAGQTSAGGCTVCAANRYPSNGACVPCLTGTFKNFAGNESCLSLPSFTTTSGIHNLTEKMRTFGVTNVSSGIGTSLLLYLDASNLAQYVNISGSLVGHQLQNLVTNNSTTVDAYTTNQILPTASVWHSNIPGNTVYGLDFNRANSNYLKVNYANPDYFANFGSGLTSITFVSFNAAANSEKILDIGSFQSLSVDNIYMGRATSSNISVDVPDANGFQAISASTIVSNERTFYAFVAGSPGARILTKGRGVIGSLSTASAIKVSQRANAYVGRSNNPFDPFFNGTIYEVMLWNRTLSDADLQKVFEYLENKYYTCGSGKFGKVGVTCTDCPVNTFMPAASFYNSSATACFTCPSNSTTNGLTGQPGCVCIAGFYPNGDLCSPCSAGSWKSTIGNATCTLCNQGMFATVLNATSASVCQNCSIGYFAAVNGSASCDPCSPGTFASTIGQSSCTNCSANFFSKSAAGSCTACGGNSSSDAGSSFCSCNPGYFASGNSCSPCGAGSYKTSRGNTSCVLCSAGTASNVLAATSASTCVACIPGTYSLQGAASCISCVAGTFSNISNATSNATCQTCPAGQWSSTGATSCNLCAAGTFSNVIGASSVATCQSCSPGYFSSATGSSACSMCLGGTYSLGGSTSCLNCSANSYSKDAADSCIACGTGSFSNEGASSCTCYAGYFNNGTSCSPCAKGTYKSSAGNSSCSLCGEGTSSDVTGATSPSTCVSCLAGTYAVAGSATCSICSLNTYSLAGAGSCIACGAYANSNVGSSMCSCNSGFYSQAGACIPCASGTYKSSSANSSCIPAEPGKYQSLTGQSTSVSCSAGTYQPNSGQTSCISCQAGTWSSVTGATASTTCNACPINTYSTTIGASSSTLCLSCHSNATTNGVSGANASAACLCMAGYEGDGVTSCSKCAVNYFKNTIGNTNCVACGTNAVTNGTTGSTLCYCPNLMYGDPKVSCTSCPAFTYKIGLTSATTTISDCGEVPTCMAGYYGDPLVGCAQCPVNSYRAGRTMNATTITDCISCAVNSSTNGVQGAQNASQCLCNPGYYQVGSTCTPCPVNTFKASAGNGDSGSCLSCPTNSVAVPGSASCECAAGYSRNFVSGVCEPCPVGTFKASRGTGNCMQVEPGKYQLSIGQSTSLACPAGTYQPNSGQTECLSCQAGTWSSATGATSADTCSPCPLNTYSMIVGASANTLCLPCHSNATINGVSGASSSSACLCKAGYEGNGATSCSQCAANYFKESISNTNCLACGTNAVTNGTTGSTVCYCPDMMYGDPKVSCTLCPTSLEKRGLTSSITAVSDCIVIPTCLAGHYGDPYISCLQCPINTYRSGITSNVTVVSDCVTCPVGSSTNGVQGAQTVSQCLCNSGYYRTGSTCTPCPVNTFKANAGNGDLSSCFTCGANSISTLGSSICQCDSGHYRNNATGECEPCSLGTFKATVSNSASCTQCAPGSYQNETAQQNCKLCPSGTHINTTGATSILECTICPINTYSANEGSVSCTRCGSFTTSSNITGSTTSSVCLCMSGYFGTGSTGCTICPGDTFKDSIGNSDRCSPCPSGLSTGDKLGATVCDVCASGYEGAAPNCAACQPGFVKEEKGNAQCGVANKRGTSSNPFAESLGLSETVFYIFTVCICLVFIGGVTLVIRYTINRQKRRKRNQIHTIMGNNDGLSRTQPGQSTRQFKQMSTQRPLMTTMTGMPLLGFVQGPNGIPVTALHNQPSRQMQRLNSKQRASLNLP